MLYEQWEKRVANHVISEKKDAGEIARLQGEIKDLVKMAKRASSERVRLEYEKQIEDMATQEKANGTKQSNKEAEN